MMVANSGSKHKQEQVARVDMDADAMRMRAEQLLKMASALMDSPDGNTRDLQQLAFHLSEEALALLQQVRRPAGLL